MPNSEFQTLELNTVNLLIFMCKVFLQHSDKETHWWDIRWGGRNCQENLVYRSVFFMMGKVNRQEFLDMKFFTIERKFII